MSDDHPGYTVLNLKEVEDMAPRFGLGPNLESRFARKALHLERSGLSYFRIAPGFRIPFGHTHDTQEEVYLVVSGSVNVKLDDEVVELHAWDVVRIAPGVARGLEGGPNGAEVVAFGAPDTDNKDVEMLQEWWTD
jgi:quercetin dioxygenase-like cupin family protein